MGSAIATHKRARLARRALALAVLALLGAFALPASALAHASLVASDPAPGSRLERAPDRIELSFAEPLAPRLSRAVLVDERGRALAARTVVAGKRIVVFPARPLARGGYRLEWSTVSTVDGHTLAGSVGFGVRAPAPGSTGAAAATGPFDVGGVLGFLGRALLYVGLVAYAGPLFAAAALGTGTPGRWLVPDTLAPRAGCDASALARRRRAVERLHARAGLAALVGAVCVALADATRAAGAFDPAALSDFLLQSRAGVGRTAVIAALALALFAPRRGPARQLFCLVAIAALALSGHAASADPQAIAVAAVFVHVVAGSAWLGGILALAAAWWRELGSEGPLRRALVPAVLEPFGLVALPAFLLVVVAGGANAALSIGSPRELWESDWGRVLLLKIELVALVAAVSGAHALVLRPRLGRSGASTTTERRHWRLVRGESWIALPVLAASAALAGFALPPRQVQATAASADPFGCVGCPPRAPDPGEIAVADHAGPVLVAAWLRHASRQRVAFELRLRDLRGRAWDSEPRVSGARALAQCGPGCWTGTARVTGGELAVTLADRSAGTARAPARAVLPASFDPGGARRARRALARAERTMRRLPAVAEYETLTSGIGRPVATRYLLVAPDRLAFRFSTGGGGVVIGPRQWRLLPDGRVTSGPYYGRFRSASWFRWSAYARYVAWLGATATTIRIALFDPATPVWYRLEIDRRSARVRRVRMIAPAHFMTQVFTLPRRVPAIRPPTDAFPVPAP
ncbi:copper resistance protein CopC/CopD [Thermoleophilum album]|uniref:copper resistance protein CopC n=1 Tax=Thermoleophilum album TaxID=29539 RepID=UPI00237D316E|nr:copper resistance protein CopC [Thermoleophilum album]WDT93937.1 copper resistance protein CopC/CopD [Thermoleophilum album]